MSYMPEQAQEGSHFQPLTPQDLARFQPQLSRSWDWFIRLLEETERGRKLRHTIFDRPVQERLKRVS
jgi:hypothetical protein